MSRPENDDGGFLGRWARRKQEAQRAAQEPAPAPQAEALPATTDAAAEDLPLPSLDSIVPGADVSAFFQAHVPEALRNAALRKLWTTDPEISSFIEMADYQWDFNNPDAIAGWGSRLDASDVSRLAQRLLGGGEEEDKAPKAVAAAETDQQVSGPPAVDDPAAIAPPEEDMRPSTEFAGHPVAGDDAVQKIPSDSVLYATAKKRHGGALPS